MVKRSFALRVARLLKPDGVLIVFVPAFQMLWSKHDEVNKRFRRYNRPRLVQALARCGLRVERGSYWNCFLFLPILIANDCPGGTSRE